MELLTKIQNVKNRALIILKLYGNAVNFYLD